MTFFNSLATMIVFCVGWAYLFPENALHLIDEIKRQKRMRLIRNAGCHYAKQLEDKLRRYARQQGIDQEIVSEVLNTHRQEIVLRLGEGCADQLLGPENDTWQSI